MSEQPKCIRIGADEHGFHILLSDTSGDRILASKPLTDLEGAVLEAKAQATTLGLPLSLKEEADAPAPSEPSPEAMQAAGALLDLMWSKNHDEAITNVEIARALDAFAAKAVEAEAAASRDVIRALSAECDRLRALAAVPRNQEMIDKAVEEEREACASLIENAKAPDVVHFLNGAWQQSMAMVIRARGTTGERK